jgi:hypothetical protein
MGESYVPIKNRVAIRTGSPISKELARKRYPITATLTLIPDPLIRTILRRRVAIYAQNPSFMTTLEVFWRFRKIAHSIASIVFDQRHQSLYKNDSAIQNTIQPAAHISGKRYQVDHYRNNTCLESWPSDDNAIANIT